MNNILRKKELENKLKSRGLEIRTDSALCTKYIEGTTDLNVDFIVERMCQMKYLFEYCNMKEIKANIYKQYLTEITRGIKSESNVTSRAEKVALDTYSNGVYPREENNLNWKYSYDWLLTKLNNNKLYIIISFIVIPIAIKLCDI